MELRGRSDSSLEEPSFPKIEFEKELLGMADVLTELSEDCRRTPTTPTSRLIAPTVPEYLESGDGTWTGSVEEEYTPTAELLDARDAGLGWELFDFAAGTRKFVLGIEARLSSSTAFQSVPLELTSRACLGCESVVPFKVWDELRPPEGFWLPEVSVKLRKE